MARLLEGRPIADKIKQEIMLSIKALKTTPVLVSVQVGENAAVQSYIRSQFRAAEGLGIQYRLEKLPQDTTEAALCDFIAKLNADKTVNGIILQLPLPAQIDNKNIISCILPQKDAEGIHPSNVGKIVFGKQEILPCTAAAVMEILNSTGIDLYGREVVLVGYSTIVGKPLSLLLLEKFATLTVCHIATSKAGKLEEHIRRADILIVAVGKAGLVKGEWIKEDAVVIDVGINRVDDTIVGDVEFEAAARRASYITPVPGGVGPLTSIMLMRNLVEAAKQQQ